jgi:hypothetical protein
LGVGLGTRRHAPIGSHDDGGENSLRKQPIHPLAQYHVGFRILCRQGRETAGGLINRVRITLPNELRNKLPSNKRQSRTNVYGIEPRISKTLRSSPP